MFAKSFGLAKIPPWALVALSPITHLEARLIRGRMGGSAAPRWMQL